MRTVDDPLVPQRSQSVSTTATITPTARPSTGMQANQQDVGVGFMDIGQLVRDRADLVYSTLSSSDPRVVSYANANDVVCGVGGYNIVEFVVHLRTFHVVCYAYIW